MESRARVGREHSWRTVKISKKKLQVILGGLPELGPLSDNELLAAWREVQAREESLRTDALKKAQALREAATAFDKVVEQLNELSHTLRHFRRELDRRQLTPS